MALEVVLDASIAIAWSLADEPWHKQAIAVARDIATDRLGVAVAPNFGFEVRHGLIRAVRRGRLDWPAFLPRVQAINALDLPVPIATLLDAELTSLCREHGLSWGDAHHALLASSLARPLLTADRRLIASLEDSGIWVEFIGDRPLD